MCMELGISPILRKTSLIRIYFVNVNYNTVLTRVLYTPALYYIAPSCV